MNPTPYDRLPNESAKAFNAFVIYRDMGIGRSIAKVRDRLGLSSDRRLQQWSADFEWQARVAQYETDRGREALNKQLQNDKAAYTAKLQNYVEQHQVIGSAGIELTKNLLIISSHLLNPIVKKVEANEPLTIEELKLFWQLRKTKEILAFGDVASNMLAEALYVRQTVEMLKGEQEE